MGACKSERMYPKHIREAIMTNLMDVYSTMYTFKETFKTRIMDIFGSDYADGVNLGTYSYLAKKLEESGLVKVMLEVGGESTSKLISFFKSISPSKKKNGDMNVQALLADHDWDEADIDLFMAELDSADNNIALVMRRMTNFRISAQLHTIAAQMPAEGEIPETLMTMIDGIVSVYGKDKTKIIKSLNRIKKSQIEGGKRLTTLNQLASVYNAADGDESDRVAAVKEQTTKLETLKPLTVDGTIESIIKMVKNTAAAQEGLPLLGKLASVYNSVEGEESDKVAVVEDDDRFALIMKSYNVDKEKAIEMIKNTAGAQEGLPLLGKLASVYNSVEGEESDKVTAVERGDRLTELMQAYSVDQKTAMVMIKNTAAAQTANGDRVKLVNELAHVYNKEGGVEAGSASIDAVTGDERFNTFQALVGGSEKDAIAAIKKAAQKTDVTWWSKYKELVRRLNDKSNDTVSIITVEDDNGDNVEVLYVKSMKNEDGVSKNNPLYYWWAEQVNLPTGSAHNKYAIKAWKMKGSLYYLALEKLGVCFDERSYDDNLNVKAAIAALDARIENADMNRDNAAVDALRGAEFNSNIGIGIREEED